MLEIRITAPEISEAINNLAKAISHESTVPAGTINSAVPANTTCAAAEKNTSAPELNNAPAPAATVPVVPTAAPQYTLEMIAKAGTALIDAGKMNELTALLAKYGVEALTALNPSQYGTFANELRSMGASI